MESPGVNKPVKEVESWADQRRTRVLWGTDRLVERLIELADSCQVFYPPTAEEIVEEAGLVMPWLESPALNPETCLGSRARQLIIQNAGVVNVFTQPAADLNCPSRTRQVRSEAVSHESGEFPTQVLLTLPSSRVEIIRPLLHQQPAPFKQVRPGVGLYYSRPYVVGQCQLHHRETGVRVLRGPIPE